MGSLLFQASSCRAGRVKFEPGRVFATAPLIQYRQHAGAKLIAVVVSPPQQM